VRSLLPFHHKLCSSLPSRSRIESKHSATGSGSALFTTNTTCAVLDERSTTTCR